MRLNILILIVFGCLSAAAVADPFDSFLTKSTTPAATETKPFDLGPVRPHAAERPEASGFLSDPAKAHSDKPVHTQGTVIWTDPGGRVHVQPPIRYY